MNLESLGNRGNHQSAENQKDAARRRPSKTRIQKSVELVDKCRGGVCEVIWKPLGGQQSIAKAAAQ